MYRLNMSIGPLKSRASVLVEDLESIMGSAVELIQQSKVDLKPGIQSATPRPHTAKSLDLRRPSSAATRISGFSEVSLVDQLTTDWRFYFSVFIPIFGVCLLSGIAIEEAIFNYIHESDLTNKVNAGRTFGDLVLALQHERGISCQFLASAGTADRDNEFELFALLGTKRRLSDKHATTVDWIHLQLVGNKTAKEWYYNIIEQVRSDIDANQIFCSDSLSTYTKLTTFFIKAVSYSFDTGYQGGFWSTTEAYNMMILYQDAVGLTRAMGANYFAAGYFTADERVYFGEIQGRADLLLNLMLSKIPKLVPLYQKIADQNLPLLNFLGQSIKMMETRDITKPNSSMILSYFDSVTYYLELIHELEDAVIDTLADEINSQINKAGNQLAYVTVIAVTVLLSSIPLTTWYAWKSTQLMDRIKIFTQQLKIREEDLHQEQRKTDQLLYQLLPKAVAKSLKEGKSVAPELFESVSLLFCEIHGFQALSAKSTPFQICTLLNMLYSTLDEIIVTLDAYKVETIGDCYMVVSGLPIRNDNRHAAEIATLGLAMLYGMEGFRVTHLDNQRLLLRCGAHTGACAAGVVGVKMPRYCLFGDTINTTSRMLTTGGACKMHISEDMKKSLDSSHRYFYTTHRGTVHVKGKSIMDTHWLLGCEDFPYRIDMNRADKLLEETTYWR